MDVRRDGRGFVGGVEAPQPRTGRRDSARAAVPSPTPGMVEGAGRERAVRGVNRIVHLQSLRALAATLVVVSHALEYLIRHDALGGEHLRLSWVVGWLGVATFFVISGLIMIRSSYGDFGSPTAATHFLRRRVIRVVPMYWLITVSIAVTAPLLGKQVSVSEFLCSLFFIPYTSPSTGSMRPLLGQGWTLNYEMIFYFLFAVALLFRRTTGIRLVVAFLISIVALRTAIWSLWPYEDPRTALQFWSDPLLLLFAAGIGVGWVEQRCAGRWHAAPFPLLTTLGLFVLAVAAFVRLGGTFPMPIGWQAILAAAGTAAVVLCTSGGDHASAAVGRVLESAGDASFSTYLIHPPVLIGLAAAAHRSGLLQPVPFVLLAVILCNVAGYLTFRLVERPLVRTLSARAAARVTIGGVAPPRTVS